MLVLSIECVRRLQGTVAKQETEISVFRKMCHKTWCIHSETLHRMAPWQPDLSDKVVFEISNVLPLLEPYHLGRGEVDGRGRGEVDGQGLVFEVKAWTVRPARPPPLRLPPP